MSTTDRLTPKFWKAEVKRHDKAVADDRTAMAALRAAYGTKWWEWLFSEKNDGTAKKAAIYDEHYEYNKCKQGVSTYLARLFPKKMKAVLGRTALTTGDPNVAENILNRWLFSDTQRARIDDLLRMAILYPGDGVKVMREAGEGAPWQRVHARAIPWWELVLDKKAGDAEDARFIGHVFWLPVEVVREKYKPELGKVQLKGRRREEWMDGTSDDTHEAPVTPNENPGDDEDCVRILEVCNLVDSIKVGGQKYRGRYEVHLLDHGMDKPLYVGPMPAYDSLGKPLPNIVPLIMEWEPGRPFKGIAPARSWLPQIAEGNAFRAIRIYKSRRDKTVHFVPESMLSDVKSKYVSAAEHEVIGVPDELWDKTGGNLQALVATLINQPQSVDVQAMLAQVDNDLDSLLPGGPSAVGVAQNATATEILNIKDYTDGEFGRMKAALERTLAQVGRLYLAMVVLAAYTDRDLAAKGKAKSKATQVESDQESAGLEKAAGGVAIETDKDAEPVGAKANADASAEGEPGAEPEDETDDAETPDESEPTFRVMDQRGQVKEVRISEIDGEFDIGFTETGRTPMAAAEKQITLRSMLDSYLDKWLKANDPKAPAVVRVALRAGMQAIYDNFDLPPNLAPDALEAAARDLEKEEAEKAGEAKPDAMAAAAAPVPPAPPGAPPLQAAPTEQGTPPSNGGEPPSPDDVLQLLAQRFADNPQVMQRIQQVAALPPEQKGQGVAALIQALAPLLQQQPEA